VRLKMSTLLLTAAPPNWCQPTRTLGSVISNHLSRASIPGIGEHKGKQTIPMSYVNSAPNFEPSSSLVLLISWIGYTCYRLTIDSPETFLRRNLAGMKLRYFGLPTISLGTRFRWVHYGLYHIHLLWSASCTCISRRRTTGRLDHAKENTD
jgi:hypothetical protein